MSARFLGLLRKELAQFLRDRTVLLLILFLYTVEAVMCTMALTFEIRHLPLAIVDQDQSVASRHLTALFQATDTFALRETTDRPERGEAALQAGRVAMVLVIPTGFEQYYQSQTRPTLQILLDGSNSNVAENARHYAMQILRRFETDRPPLRAPPPRSFAIAEPITRLWYNPDQETKNFMVLSMMALAGMLVGVIVPAASIVREKEHGTIEQLLVTPVTPIELFLAKTIPTVGINLIAIFPALLIVGLFDVPQRGSLVTLLVLAAIFQLSAIAIGVFVAAVTRTLQQALLLAFFALFPVLFLSGTMTPIESMPPVLQAASRLSPLRYYMEVLLGVFLKGTGFVELWPQALSMLVIGIALFAASAIVFRRKLV
jgi:ABC-2 type transport system permease protein